MALFAVLNVTSFLIMSPSQLGLGMIEEDKEVTTTRLTPFSFATFSTFIVPLTVRSRCSMFQEQKRERDAQFFLCN